MTADLDALVARLRAHVRVLARAPSVPGVNVYRLREDCAAAADALLALRQEMADEDAGSALALRQRDTARGDFERAELARATASAERDAALREIADHAEWAREYGKTPDGQASLDWAKRVARAEAERDAALPLARFGLACLDVSRKNLGDLEGGWVQDKATELGVLTAVEVTEPCRPENCVCAEYGFPCLCYRDSEATKAFRVLDARPEPGVVEERCEACEEIGDDVRYRPDRDVPLCDSCDAALIDTSRLDKAEALLAAGGDIMSTLGRPHRVALKTFEGLRYSPAPTLRAALDACPEPAGEEGHDG